MKNWKAKVGSSGGGLSKLFSDRFGGLKNRFLGDRSISSYWRDVSWLAGGTVVAQMLALVVMPIWSRLFTPEEFSVQALFWNIVCVLSILATWRFESVVQIPEDEETAEKIVKIVVRVSLILVLIGTPIAYLCREQIAGLLDSPMLAKWLFVVPLTAALVSIATALQATAQRRECFRESAIATIAGRLAMCVAIPLGAFLIPGAGGLVLGWTAGYAARTVYLLQVVRTSGLLGFRIDMTVVKSYVKRAGGLGFSHLIFTLTVLVPNIFILKQYGDTELGLFSLAFQVVLFPSALVGAAIADVYYQRIAKLYAQGEGIHGFWLNTIQKSFLFGFPAYGLLALIVYHGFAPIFGLQWEASATYGAVLTVNAFASFVGSGVSRTCVVVGAWWYAPVFQTFRLLTIVLAAWGAAVFDLSMTSFILIFSVSGAFAYGMDILANWWFSCRASL